MKKLFCPFCGGEVNVQLTDSEGNFHNGSYLDDPYSGVGYVLTHCEREDVFCPIAREEGEPLGRYIYDTEEEARKSWDTIDARKRRQEDEGWPYSFPYTCKTCKYFVESGEKCSLHHSWRYNYTYTDTPVCDDFIPLGVSK